MGYIDVVNEEATRKRWAYWDKKSPRVGERHPGKWIRLQGLSLILSKDLVMSLYPGGTRKRKEHLSAPPSLPHVSRNRKGKFLWFQGKDKQRSLEALTPGGRWVTRNACWFEECAIPLPLSPHVFFLPPSFPSPPSRLPVDGKSCWHFVQTVHLWFPQFSPTSAVPGDINQRGQ